MTGDQAEQLGRQLALHLRRNHFAQCYNILNHVEEELRQQAEDKSLPTAIAELELELRLVNMLEKAGYLYVRQLVGVDLVKLDIPNFDIASKLTLARALGRPAKELVKIWETTSSQGKKRYSRKQLAALRRQLICAGILEGVEL